MPNFLLFLNRDLRVEFCNDHSLKNTHWTRERTRPHVSEILGPQRYAERRGYYERALAGETFTFESTGAVGNEAGYFRFYYHPSFDEQGNVYGVFSAATDISERRAAEVALEGKQVELTRSNQDLEQFAYVASLDLKAPLRAMGLLVQWIRADLGGYDAGSFVFSVLDDGEGIPLEYAERVFQMFQTLKPRDEVEGSGMGLAIVSRIIAWQGGRVWFEPVAGGTGTIFKFQWLKSAAEGDTARTDEVTQWRMARR